MAEIKLNDILSLLKNVRRVGSGYTSRCPAHNDNKNSLSLKDGGNGKALFNCFAGCSYQDIIGALGIPTNGGESQKRFEAIYNYTDETGTVLYQNVRYEGKDFRWRHLDRNGREVWNLNNVRRIPYRLPDLLSLPTHYDFVLAEGEKDADSLREKGLIATNHKNWQSEFNYLLKGRKVIIFQDHDRPGVKNAEKVAQVIFHDAKAVKIVDCFAGEPLPDKHGKDVSDYLKAHGFEELNELILRTPNWEPLASPVVSSEADQQELKVLRLSDVKAEEIVWLWKPFIPIGEFTIVEGIEGLGKSWISCALACAVAGGRKLPFGDSEPLEPGNVLMLSAEDSLSHTVKPRLLSMNANLDRIFAIDEVFSFSDFKDLIKFEAVIIEYQPKLVIIDPIFSYTGGKNLNQESDSRPIARKLIEIAQKYNCAIAGVRHIGKAKGNGDARAAGLGSIAWRASARSVLLVGKDEETGEKAVCQTKNNLAEESKISVGFEIENGKFFWKAEPSRLTKEKMLSQPKDDEAKAEQTEAVEFLREALRNGECSSKEIEKEARGAGVSTYALRKAKTALNIESFKKGGNFGGEKGWYMRLPDAEKVDQDAEDVDSLNFGYLQSNITNKTAYTNRLSEDVEKALTPRLQSALSASSAVLVPQIRMKAVCKCGAGGFLGEPCEKCGEVIIPF